MQADRNLRSKSRTHNLWSTRTPAVHLLHMALQYTPRSLLEEPIGEEKRIWSIKCKKNTEKNDLHTRISCTAISVVTSTALWKQSFAALRLPSRRNAMPLRLFSSRFLAINHKQNERNYNNRTYFRRSISTPFFIGKWPPSNTITGAILHWRKRRTLFIQYVNHLDII